MRFMMLCKARGLNPFEGDAFLIGYDQDSGPQFSLVTAIQAFLKRAEVHPEFDGMDSGVIVKDETGELRDREGDFLHPGDMLLGGWATVYCKNRSRPTKRRLSLGTFQKPTKIWRENTAGMIVKCAEADALRSTFPSTLAGMYLNDEMPMVFDGHSAAAIVGDAGAAATKSDALAAHLAARQAPTEDEYSQDSEVDPMLAVTDEVVARRDRMRKEINGDRSQAEAKATLDAMCGPDGWLADEEEVATAKGLYEARCEQLASEADAGAAKGKGKRGQQDLLDKGSPPANEQ